MAAALIALMPGQFLVRSLLGFTDHHIAEVLLSSIVLMFLVLATYRRTHSIRRLVLFGLASGTVLAAYLLMWPKGRFLILVIVAWVMAQTISNLARGWPTRYLTGITTPMFALTLAIVTIASWADFAVSTTTPVVAAGLALDRRRRQGSLGRLGGGAPVDEGEHSPSVCIEASESPSFSRRSSQCVRLSRLRS